MKLAKVYRKAAEEIERFEDYCCHAINYAQGLTRQEKNNKALKIFEKTFKPKQKEVDVCDYCVAYSPNEWREAVEHYGYWGGVGLGETESKSARVMALLFMEKIAKEEGL